MAWTMDGLGQKGNKMKNRLFKALQLFADGEGNGTNGNGTGTLGEGAAGTQPAQLSFDDFLLQEGNQAEFDRRVQKAIQTAVTNAQRKWQTIADGRVSEAEKLSRMTAEEKAEYRAKKAEDELSALKRQITLGEMASTARKMLSDEQINVPDEIIMNLVSDDAEKTKTAVEGFSKVFKEAVQMAVKDALRGNLPKSGTDVPAVTRDQIMAVKNKAERQRLIAENPQLFIRR